VREERGVANAFLKKRTFKKGKCVEKGGEGKSQGKKGFGRKGAWSPQLGEGRVKAMGWVPLILSPQRVQGGKKISRGEGLSGGSESHGGEAQTNWKKYGLHRRER